MKEKLSNYFSAGFPGIAINTYEEQRAIADIIAAAKGSEKKVITWSATEGAKMISPQVKDYQDTQDLMMACSLREPDSVYILRDISGWPFDRDPVLTRSFRDLLTWAGTEEGGSCVVVIGASYTPPASCEKQIIVMEYTLPDEDALRKIAENVAKSGDVKFNGSEEIIRALSGLSSEEAANACALSIVETGALDSKIIYREKVQNVKKSGLLEIIDPDPRGVDAIGGLDLLKAFLIVCAETLRRWKEALAYPIAILKGIMVVGPPGTGKSLTAKCAGTILNLPVLRWDIARTFASLVGETERRTAETLALAEAMAPCVLWLDEVDKGFAGTQSGGQYDSGVGMKMFGQVLTWMQERKKPVFLFCTANDVSNLPSAVYRKGRFDQIFALDLPNRQERMAIFDVHLKKRRRKDIADLMELADASKDFVGAEIEAVIEEAMRNAFSEKREVTEADIKGVIRKTVPLAITAKAEINRMREWSRSNAVPASSPEVTPTVTTTTRKIGKK